MDQLIGKSSLSSIEALEMTSESVVIRTILFIIISVLMIILAMMGLKSSSFASQTLEMTSESVVIRTILFIIISVRMIILDMMGSFYGELSQGFDEVAQIFDRLPLYYQIGSGFENRSGPSNENGPPFVDGGANIPSGDACKNEDQVVSFDGLPDLPLLNIFEFLPVADLYRCSRVCRRWFYLARDPSLWRKVDIELNETESTGLKNRDIVKALQFSTPNIGKLRIYAPCRSLNCKINLSEISKVMKSCPALQYFFMHNVIVLKWFWSFQKDSLFEHLPESVRVLSLRAVEFQFCRLISTENDALFPNIESFEFFHWEPSLTKQAVLSASKMVNLQELRLPRCTSVTDEDMLCLTGIIPNLVVLHLEFTRVGSGTFNLLKQFAQRLEKLYLALTVIENDDFYFDEDCFPNLKEICLAFTGVTARGVARLLESCQNLKRVYLAMPREKLLIRRFPERIQYVAGFKDCDHRLNFNSV